MRFHVVTIFPSAFDSLLQTSLIGKAVAAGRLQVDFVDPRELTTDRHHSVDDTPYGGGEGMVIKPEPIVAALEAIDGASPDKPHRVLLTPQGARLRQSHLHRLLARRHAVLVCGRYEGFDERIRAFVDEELSLGDFVLSGGEVAAMAIIDGVARLEPGVIGKAESLLQESHADGLLEYPQYTRPRSFRGHEVPQILLQGDHERIRRWRRQQMLLRTRDRRPDLWAEASLGAEDRELVRDRLPAAAAIAPRTYVALLHHPVYDRTGRIVTTAITNLDLHDIARSARTYGLAGYFVVTPLATQQELARRIMAHWKEGHGAAYNEQRREALSRVQVAADLDQVTQAVEKLEGSKPLTIATTAAVRPDSLAPAEVLHRLAGGRPAVLLLGTGWGLAQEVLQAADVVLQPVRGFTDYNHLSVRSAAAILLDRLFGMREKS